jgi:hypothetical protein
MQHAQLQRPAPGAVREAQKTLLSYTPSQVDQVVQHTYTSRLALLMSWNVLHKRGIENVIPNQES